MHFELHVCSLLPGPSRLAGAGAAAATAGVPCWPPHGTPLLLHQAAKHCHQRGPEAAVQWLPPALSPWILGAAAHAAASLSGMPHAGGGAAQLFALLYALLVALLFADCPPSSQAFAPGWLRAWSPAHDGVTCIFSTLLHQHQQCSPVKLAGTTAPAVLSSPRELSEADRSFAECPGAPQLFDYASCPIDWQQSDGQPQCEQCHSRATSGSQVRTTSPQQCCHCPLLSLSPSLSAPAQLLTTTACCLQTVYT